MTASTLWQRYQDGLYYHPDLERYLDISRIKFDEVLEGRHHERRFF